MHLEIAGVVTRALRIRQEQKVIFQKELRERWEKSSLEYE